VKVRRTDSQAACGTRYSTFELHASAPTCSPPIQVTTVGYGAYTPQTDVGRLLTTLLGLFGVAWFGYLLVLVSERVNYTVAVWAKATYKRCHASFTGKVEKLEEKAKNQVKEQVPSRHLRSRGIRAPSRQLCITNLTTITPGRCRADCERDLD